MTNQKGRDIRREAMTFIVLMGVVSLLSDMTHESASSILGAYLSLAGASAAAVGFISGLGEWVGGLLRLVTGFVADKTKRYWPLTIIGYAVDVFAVPMLALVPRGGWMWACALILIERTGKAIKKPAKDTLLSFAAKQNGAGKSFAIQEALDQIGAFLGPVLLAGAMMLPHSGDTFTLYARCLGLLSIPAAATIAVLLLARRRFPAPETFEPPQEPPALATGHAPQAAAVSRPFLFYLAGISLFALGFVNFALVILHVSNAHLLAPERVPLLYAAAMLIDAFAALVFGWLFDRHGVAVLILATLISAGCSAPIFLGGSLGWLVCGALLWGVGMGAQESVLKSAVTVLVPREKRGRGFGIFQTAFGFCWFAGSWLMGILYTRSPAALVAFSIAAQLASLPFFWLTARRART
jgi:MFS family permease